MAIGAVEQIVIEVDVTSLSDVERAQLTDGIIWLIRDNLNAGRETRITRGFPPQREETIGRLCVPMANGVSTEEETYLNNEFKEMVVNLCGVERFRWIGVSRKNRRR